MKWWQDSVRFYLGGMGYVGLELLWRGWSHGSMFLVGGSAFLLLGHLPKLPLFRRAVLGATGITVLEFCSGILINRVLDLGVWDYSNQPFHILGQVCPTFFFLWIGVAILAMGLWDVSGKLLFAET